MEIIAVQKYLLLSPKKIRPIARLAKKLNPSEAVEKLPFVYKKGAGVLVKVIKSALANAKNKGISEDALFIKEIQINEGPRLKRGKPVSKGSWHPIKKRMSHIRVILGVKNAKTKGDENKKYGTKS